MGKDVEGSSDEARRGYLQCSRCPITLVARHIYHDLDLLMEEETIVYVDTYRDWEFDFVDEPIATSGMQTEVEKAKPTNEEEDTAKTGGVNVAETLAAMVGKGMGKYIQSKPQAK